MKTTFPHFGKTALTAGLPVFLLFASCTPSAEEKAKFESVAYAMSDSVAAPVSATAVDNTETKADTHVFLRTADLKFSVKDVRRSTEEIERIVRANDGFVTYTNLKGTNTDQGSTRISKDTLVRISSISIVNEITLRVPNENLDSTLLAINMQVDFMDNRVIKADDVKLQLLSGKLAGKRNKEHLKKLDKVISSQGKKLNQTINALENLSNEASLNDAQELSLLELKDQVNYSTVTLFIYQAEKKEFKKAAFIPAFEPYVPSFADKMKTASATGLEILEGIAIFLVTIWPFALLTIVIWSLVKWLSRKKLLSKLIS
ncbi:MAG: DUF4349 domain-containing protein [Bacteroidia bacterium]